VFAGADLPNVGTALRRLNLWILGNFSIHSSVFPSAHASSAFSAAWGLLATLPERRWVGWAMAAYGVCVSIATVYCRYHYAVDVAAGAALSFAGPLLAYRKSRGA
jgi:membrane-associated phospholipid phosphatase